MKIQNLVDFVPCKILIKLFTIFFTVKIAQAHFTLITLFLLDQLKIIIQRDDTTLLEAWHLDFSFVNYLSRYRVFIDTQYIYTFIYFRTYALFVHNLLTFQNSLKWSYTQWDRVTYQITCVWKKKIFCIFSKLFFLSFCRSY